MTTPQQLAALADKLEHIASGGQIARTAYREFAYLELRLSESGVNVLLEVIRELRNSARTNGDQPRGAEGGESMAAQGYDETTAPRADFANTEGQGF